MDTSKIFQVLLGVAGKIEQDLADKEITVMELLQLIQTVITDLGIENDVVINLSKTPSNKK